MSWLRHSGDNVHLLTVGNLTYADDSRLSIHHRYPGNWTLVISQSVLEDSGCYQCQINTHPLISLYVWLVVQGPSFSTSSCCCFEGWMALGPSMLILFRLLQSRVRFVVGSLRLLPSSVTFRSTMVEDAEDFRVFAGHVPDNSEQIELNDRVDDLDILGHYLVLKNGDHLLNTNDDYLMKIMTLLSPRVAAS